MNNLSDLVLYYLSEINDPEIPVVNIVELGIVRNVSASKEKVDVEITPTYSGCPAIHTIKEEIIEKLDSKGFQNINLRTVYSPSWTTDWITDEAREKLRKYGISTPPKNISMLQSSTLLEVRFVHCPFCNSGNTVIRSSFGSTACKSFYFCNSCNQMFEHFKSI
jgi:ring-1,2-phenylacetyl-CoA epoxidase subunit PaaD